MLPTDRLLKYHLIFFRIQNFELDRFQKFSCIFVRWGIVSQGDYTAIAGILLKPQDANFF